VSRNFKSFQKSFTKVCVVSRNFKSFQKSFTKVSVVLTFVNDF
jgi:hypothetical protein